MEKSACEYRGHDEVVVQAGGTPSGPVHAPLASVYLRLPGYRDPISADTRHLGLDGERVGLAELAQ
jgi:hypothetical protein